jgi:hypothetical protein
LTSVSRADLDRLLNAVLPLAERHLAKSGEFYPFGASMDADGGIAIVEAHTGTERPLSSDLLALLWEGMRDSARGRTVRAVAVCCDVRLREPRDDGAEDAIAVEMEHADGEAVNVYAPYVRRGDTVTIGELFATRRTRRVFGEPSWGDT